MKRNIKVRKALVWKACHRVERFWKSILPRNIKVSLFFSTVEYVLLYGCEAWALKKSTGEKAKRLLHPLITSDA